MPRKPTCLYNPILNENIAPNLVAYINGFSETARRIFEKFKFADQIEKLDSSNRLFINVKAMAGIDLHPDRISNIEMGYIFEHLVMKFNAQANERAGDNRGAPWESGLILELTGL